MAIQFKRKNRPRRTPGGSMADIAFLLLIFFLVATTIFNEKGVKITLPEWKPKAQIIGRHVDHLVKIFVNGKDEILYQGETISKRDFERIMTDNLSLFLKEDKKVQVTVSLGYDRSTNYGTYLSVLDGIKKAFGKIYDDFAMANFNHKFDKCDNAEKNLIINSIALDIWEMPLSDYLVNDD